MTVNELKTQIKAFATSEDLTYIRGTELEANFKLDDIDTSKRVMVQFDQTEITAVSSVGSLLVLVVPVQILFLQIDPEHDSDLATIDNNIEDCERDALKFYSYLLGLQNNAIVSNVQDIPAPSFERLDAFKRFDSFFSGVLFNCSIPILANDYFCPAVVTGFPYTFPATLS